MKIIGSKAIVGALIIGTFIGTNNVSAYRYDTTSVFRAKYQEDGQDDLATNQTLHII